MAQTSINPLSSYMTGIVAILALMGSVVQFVWTGSRSDVTALESRLERSVVQIERQIDEMRRSDALLLPLSVHNEFKTQIERQVFRNTEVIDELLVKKEVFDRAIADQKVRDDLAHSQHDKDIDMLRSRISAMRQHLDNIDKDLRERGR